MHAEHVVLYDLDRKFDGIRLYHVLLTHLKNLPGEQQLRCSLTPCKHGLTPCKRLAKFQMTFHPACFTCMQRSMTIMNVSQVRFEGSLCRMQHCDLLCREEDAVNAAKEAFSRFHLVCLH